MATKYPDIFAALAKPFRPSEERTRKHDGARYITARTAMNRLDEVLGPENWTADSTPWGEDAVYCRLTITLPDGGKVTKADVGANAQMNERAGGKSDPGDDDKAGVSDALKRAAVQFGVGRYLYGDGVPRYGATSSGEEPVEPERRTAVATTVPAPTRDQPSREEWSGAGHGEEARHDDRRGDDQAPRSGRALFAWTKDQDEKHDYGLLKYLGGWASRQGFPQRMVDWNNDQVKRAYGEGCGRIRAIHQSAELQEGALSS